jgi:hypothetical protein
MPCEHERFILDNLFQTAQNSEDLDYNGIYINNKIKSTRAFLPLYMQHCGLVTPIFKSMGVNNTKIGKKCDCCCLALRTLCVGTALCVVYVVFPIYYSMDENRIMCIPLSHGKDVHKRYVLISNKIALTHISDTLHQGQLEKVVHSLFNDTNIMKFIFFSCFVKCC